MTKVALVGNPNCGKTTCFNVLTNSSLKVSNFPGTTVSQTEKQWIKDSSVTIVDLPGVYSLTPYTPEEAITTQYLLHESVDFIFNLIDTTTCSRGLFLTLQCMELEIPMIIIFNFFDDSINLTQLSFSLKLPCFSINTITQTKIFHYMSILLTRKKHILVLSFYDQSIQNYIFSQSCSPFLCLQTLEQHNYDSLIAQNRYDYLQRLLKLASLNTFTKKGTLIDSWLLSKVRSYLFLIIVFFTIFIFSFGIIGPFFSKQLTNFINSFFKLIDVFRILIHPILFSLITEGILKGCLSVIQFLPLIIVLFFFLSLLEESGYLARVAVLMDQPLRQVGCSGKSFVPLLLGLGCSVPAILATRILKNAHERKRIIFLLPFLSCSAKIPVYSFFAFLFFPHYAGLIILLLYFSGLFLGLVFLSFMPSQNNSFLLELPPYRWPNLINTFHFVKEKIREFLHKVFSILLLLHVFLWFLQSFTFDFTYTINLSESILYSIAESITWIFTPLGFSDWRITTALIAGFSAKEAILSTLTVLFQSNDITQVLSLRSAFSLLLFILLYCPCIATVSITLKEAGLKSALFMIFFQFMMAWVISFVFYSVMCLI